MKNQVILVDWDFFEKRAVFLWSKERKIPPIYKAFSSLLSCLKKIKVNKSDLIILCKSDYKKSWRKRIDPSYKEEEYLKRENYGIDWKKQFEFFDSFMRTLEISTPFHFVQIKGVESKDIIGYASRYYSDKDILIISSNNELKQLCSIDRVNIVSPTKKKYVIVYNPYKEKEKLIYKNLSKDITTSSQNKAEYKRRKSIFDLMSLPEEVEQKIELSIRNIKDREYYDISQFKYKGLSERIGAIYDNSKVASIRDSLKKKKTKKKILNLTI